VPVLEGGIQNRTPPEAGTTLRATVMVVMMMVVVVRDSSECGTCERNQQQRTSKKLLHGQNVARVFPQWKERCAPNQDRKGSQAGSEPL
jgi:hypothetical protein